MEQEPRPAPTSEGSRRFPASRLRRRATEQLPPETTPSDPLPMGGRSLGGGRVQVYGCSPRFLLLSIVLSLILTIVLNALF